MALLINVLVTSTKRKRMPIPQGLCLRDLTNVPVEQRTSEWIARLTTTESRRFVAEDLYAGDHWQISRSLPEHGQKVGWNVQLWICSPGYGLIRNRAEILPYSTNYSVGHPDGIMNGAAGERFPTLQAWWAKLAEWAGPEPGQPRTAEELVRRFPNSPLLVVASETIVKILTPDLLSAIRRMKDSGQFVIVSGGTPQAGGLGPHVLPCDARLQAVFGGARMSLNARTVRFLLETGPTEQFALEWARRLTDLLKNAPRLARVERIPMSDEDLIEFILKSLYQDRFTTWSRLLRQLRDSGYRCEQKRFAAIFKGIVRDQG